MNVIRIHSLDDARLEIYRNLKKTNLTRREDLFVVEGATNTKRLLQSRYPVHSILVAEHRYDEIAEVAGNDTTILVVTNQLATELVGFKFHMGVMASAARLPQPELSSVLPCDGGSLILFGDHMIDQQNVGMLIRIGAAFGADAVILGPGSADPFSRRVIKVSMGNGLFMPIIQTTSPTETLSQLQNLSYEVCATVLNQNAEELSTFQFNDRTVLMFGNETQGLSEERQALCNRHLTISMLNGTDSLNVAIAAGIFSHTWRTQFPKQH